MKLSPTNLILAVNLNDALIENQTKIGQNLYLNNVLILNKTYIIIQIKEEHTRLFGLYRQHICNES